MHRLRRFGKPTSFHGKAVFTTLSQRYSQKLEKLI